MERKPFNLENKIQGVIEMWRRERTLANESGHRAYPIDEIPQDQEIVLFQHPQLEAVPVKPPVMPSEQAYLQRRSMRRISQDGKR